jgi:hypothetical protein
LASKYWRRYWAGFDRKCGDSKISRSSNERLGTSLQKLKVISQTEVSFKYPKYKKNIKNIFQLIKK